MDNGDTIILAAVNSRFSHSNLALRYLRQYAAGTGYRLEVREHSIQEKPEDIAASIAAEKPAAAAFSVYIWNTVTVKKIIPRLKEYLPSCKIILGGPEVSYNADAWLDFPADFIVTGRGEEGFRSLLARGLSWDGPVISVPNPHLASLPMPYTDDDFERLRHRVVYYESSRGCPFNCSYCLSSISDQTLELRDTATVKEELEYLVSHNPDTIKFVDRTFNAQGERSRELWDFIISRFGGRTTAFHFEIHPSLMEDRDFEVLSRAPEHLLRFEVGLQSTNPATLAEIGRAQRWPRTKNAVQRLVALGKFHVHMDLLAGLPFEDMQSQKKSFDDAWSLRSDYLQLGFLKVLPGTAMALKLGDYGIAHDDAPPYTVRETKWISRGEMEFLDRVAHLVNMLHNTGNFSVTLTELEPLHDAPSGMFWALASFYGEVSGRTLTRDWEQGAEFIAAYVRKNFPDIKEFFSDCLRWDWCASRAPRRYPPFLRSEKKFRARRDIHLHLKDISGTPISPAGLKGKLVFVSETERFREKYLGSGGMKLFPD